MVGYGQLQVPGLSGRVGEISNMFDISATLVSDPNFRPLETGLSVHLTACRLYLSVNETGLSVTSIWLVPNIDFQTVHDDSPTAREE